MKGVPPSGGGCREPSPGQERAGSWPFGLPSSRLRPSACALRLPFVSYGRGGQLLARPHGRDGPSHLVIKIEGRAGQQAGRCSSSRGSKCMAREIALQLPTAQAMMHTWSVDNCTARSGPCWGLARWTILRARTAAAQERPSATKGCTLGSASPTRRPPNICPKAYMS